MKKNSIYITDQIIRLHPKALSAKAENLRGELLKRIIGQSYAIDKITASYQIFQAGLANSEKPVSSFLLMGPTGTGKTRIVEAVAEIFFGKNINMLKVDCAEYSHSHEIARLIGSPPGYLGHNETPPYLTQKNIDRHQTEENAFTILLFDEIEKANPSLWQLLLGILDKGRLTLGNNKTVDLTRCFIFMTSNVGSKAADQLINPSIGFHTDSDCDNTDSVKKIVSNEAKKVFSPEFLNRLDHKIVFHSLTEEQVDKILTLELQYIKARLENSTVSVSFDFNLMPAAKRFLLKKGFDKRYGGRPMKRALERYLIYPLSGLIASNQLDDDDQVIVDYSESEKELIFKKQPLTFSACGSFA